MTRKDLDRYINSQEKIYGDKCCGVYTCNSSRFISDLDGKYLGKNAGTFGHNWTAYRVNLNNSTDFIILLYEYYRNYDINGYSGKDSKGYYFSNGHNKKYICYAVLDIYYYSDINIGKIGRKIDQMWHEAEEARDAGKFRLYNKIAKEREKLLELYGKKQQNQRKMIGDIMDGKLSQRVRVFNEKNAIILGLTK